MIFKNLRLYFFTIQRLSFRQIFWRVFKNFIYVRKPDQNFRFEIRELDFLKKRNNSISTDLSKFNILNLEFKYSELPINIHKIPRLWVYNLNYLDFLNHEACHNDDKEKLNFLFDFLDLNNANLLIEPYPASLRLVNLLKWIQSSDVQEKIIINFIYEEANYIYCSIEWDLMANHLLANAKALIFAGSFFRSKHSEKWLKKGKKIFFSQLSEQILEDGGHFESSPMYHSIILEDMLDIFSLLKRNHLAEDEELTFLKEKINSMLEWLESMIHPDGKIAFFNDANYQVPEDFCRLYDHAKRLGCNPKRLVDSFPCIYNRSNSGFHILQLKDSKVFFNIGDPAPKYNPGHFHADTLSIEISIGSRRIISNTGLSTYEDCSERHFERSTYAHNTVLINENNSSEVWKSFRVSRNAQVTKSSLKKGKEFTFSSAQYKGFDFPKNEYTHKRSILASEGLIHIRDSVTDHAKSSKVIWIINPCNDVEYLDKFTIKIKQEKLLITLRSENPMRIEDTYYAPEFFLRLPCKRVVIDFKKTNNSYFRFL